MIVELSYYYSYIPGVHGLCKLAMQFYVLGMYAVMNEVPQLKNMTICRGKAMFCVHVQNFDRFPVHEQIVFCEFEFDRSRQGGMVGLAAKDGIFKPNGVLFLLVSRGSRACVSHIGTTGREPSSTVFFAAAPRGDRGVLRRSRRCLV